jgi:hypothetical protein
MSGRIHMLTPKAVLAIVILLGPIPVTLGASSSGAGMQTAVRDNLTVNWVNQKTPAIHGFVRPTPTEYMKAIDEKKEVLRARVMLDDSTTVEFYEKPRDIDFYDSTIVVSRTGQAGRSYNVGERIKHQALSLAHVAIIPSGNGRGLLVCEYEGGAVGAREGFAVLRFSPTGFELHTLPLTNFGKVVVFAGKPERAEVWSALPYPAGSDADPMVYATQSCRWENEGYQCAPPKRHRGSFGPAAIDDPGIEIRP